MAGVRTVFDDRSLTGGILTAVGVAVLAVAGHFWPVRQQEVTAPASAPPAAAAYPSVAPVETLPPTVVVAERDEVDPSDCAPGDGGIGDRRCVSPSPRPALAGEPSRRDP